MKRYKYKREHFSTQEAFERFRKVRAKAAMKWLQKEEPDHKERRILRQRLYSRYHYQTDMRLSFSQWLKEKLGIDDIKSLPIEQLRIVAAKS